MGIQAKTCTRTIKPWDRIVFWSGFMFAIISLVSGGMAFWFTFFGLACNSGGWLGGEFGDFLGTSIFWYAVCQFLTGCFVDWWEVITESLTAHTYKKQSYLPWTSWWWPSTPLSFTPELLYLRNLVSNFPPRLQHHPTFIIELFIKGKRRQRERKTNSQTLLPTDNRVSWNIARLYFQSISNTNLLS